MISNYMTQREIKFRAYQDGGMYHDVSTNGKRVWWGTPIGGGLHEYDLPRMEVKLMQFTGLKDKNGKEIYEGDVVETDEYIGEIVWGKSGWVFVGENEFTGSQCMLHEVNQRSEVIGNVMENPELLKNNG